MADARTVRRYVRGNGVTIPRKPKGIARSTKRKN